MLPVVRGRTETAPRNGKYCSVHIKHMEKSVQLVESPMMSHVLHKADKRHEKMIGCFVASPVVCPRDRLTGLVDVSFRKTFFQTVCSDALCS